MNFFFFLGLSQPGLDRNNARMKFINFLKFFPFVWELSSPVRVGTKFGIKFFSLSFLAYLSPVWMEKMPE